VTEILAGGAGALLLALALDALIGWPDRLYRRIGHPVTWLGALIGWLETRLNRATWPAPTRRLAGLLAALAVIGAAVGCGAAIQAAAPGDVLGAVVSGVCAWPLIALRSMHTHVAAVARPLDSGELPAARAAVAMIVGRDTARLDAHGVARAALESLAENTSDGVVAPVFWGVAFGLPGIAAYKAINTLDSMIGHRTPRHAAFGWASARIDDLANLAPARLTGLLFAAVSARPGAALACMARDARRHRSPNAGWPEAAMAGALGVRLSGPRVYADRLAPEPWLNGDARDAGAADLARGLALYGRAMAMLAGLVALCALI